MEKQSTSPLPVSVRKKILMVSREIGPIQKTGKNEHFKSKYIQLNGILDVLEPLMVKYKLGMEVSQAEFKEGYEGITITIFDEDDISSDKIYTKYIPLAREDAQAVGSADTYLRRYLLVLIFNLQSQDDDGNAASASRFKSAVSEPLHPRAQKGDKEQAIAIGVEAGFQEKDILAWNASSPDKHSFANAVKFPERFKAAMEVFVDDQSVF